MESKSLKLEFLNGSRFSKTRDAIFHNSSKRYLTYYIEILNMISLLIPPQKSNTNQLSIQLQDFWQSILNFKTTFRFILKLNFKKEKKKELVYVD